MTQKECLLVFSIGPVQSFIAAARKLEDLWGGSYVLAHLAEHAMACLKREGSESGTAVEMVFPAETAEDANTTIQDREDVASTPNRVIAIVAGDENITAQLVRHAEEAVRGELRRICRASIDEVFREINDRTSLYQQAEKQADDTLELFWAIEPLSDRQLFENARTRLEKRLAAVKNNRSFASYVQTGLICTVCGERDALYASSLDPNATHQKDTQTVAGGQTTALPLADAKDLKQMLRATWNRRNKHLKRYRGGEKGEGRIKDGEFLCGLCLSKRISRDFFRREMKARRRSFGSFESTTHLARTYDDNQTYYAIISMDGDDMGRWLSGEQGLSSTRDSRDSLAQNRAISERLTRFAREIVPKCVQEFDGELVYAGGDDVLAFAPLESAFPLAHALRRSFSDEDTGLDRCATASMGIVIAHYKAPLYNILNWAREMEAAAKRYVHIDGKKRKDAFAIAYLPRGGERRFAVIPWLFSFTDHTINGRESTIEVVQKLIEQLGKEVSSKFVYAFGQTFMPLLGSKPDARKLQIFPNDAKQNHSLIRLEIERLLQRALKESHNADRARELALQLVDVYRVIPSTRQFIHLLEIIRNLEVRADESAVHAPS